MKASWADSLAKFALCDVRAQGLWQDIRSLEVKFWFYHNSWRFPDHGFVDHFFNKQVGQQQHYRKWWKEVTVTKVSAEEVKIIASM